ncbi:FmdB family zinc ribbon protein [Kallotenue papyrolyticum]|uniref:FmdB family zinc ribbon protein n=1 Tax=Kallotenue papyrolyticum TaxID=1325125 RepID=UPI0004786427|nr:FmdB family zinc ribbon protein [Kallotenue papyrolyticum]
MPTYVYGCDACGHRFERFQRFADDPIRTCPQCNSAVRRIFQPAGIVFKGSGWHITDYKRSGNGSAGETSNGKSESGNGKAEAGAGSSAATSSTAAAAD